jgi:hypothetical protein
MPRRAVIVYDASQPPATRTEELASQLVLYRYLVCVADGLEFAAAVQLDILHIRLFGRLKSYAARRRSSHAVDDQDKL